MDYGLPSTAIEGDSRAILLNARSEVLRCLLLSVSNAGGRSPVEPLAARVLC